MFDDDEDIDWSDVPTPTLELGHKSVEFELYLWKTGDVYSIITWERRGDANKLIRAEASYDIADALHAFAIQMNELEMYK